MSGIGDDYSPLMPSRLSFMPSPATSLGSLLTSPIASPALRRAMPSSPLRNHALPSSPCDNRSPNDRSPVPDDRTPDSIIDGLSEWSMRAPSTEPPLPMPQLRRSISQKSPAPASPTPSYAPAAACAPPSLAVPLTPKTAFGVGVVNALIRAGASPPTRTPGMRRSSAAVWSVQARRPQAQRAGRNDLQM